MLRLLKSLAWFFLLVGISIADVVKPALVEISILHNYQVEVRIDLSLEAAMTEIGTQYKNTTESPSSAEYDELRALQPELLHQRFKAFEPDFLNSFQLSINGKPQLLSLNTVKIDIVGYKKRPRKTVLTYVAQPKELAKTLAWQYHKASGDSALRYQIVKKNQYNWSQWQWLRDGKPSGTIDINHPQLLTTTQQFLQFTSIGFEHVIPMGWDHLLFIIGLALSSLLWRKLLLLLTTFTLAHTLTLGLAMFGVVEISARIVEPLIAFSIAYVAIENLLIKQSIRRKSIIVFLFGLIHGLGFANILKQFEMAQNSFLTTLIGFNIGVELAQIVIVATVVMVLLGLRTTQLNYRQLAVVPVSVLIALVGIWWGIERLIN